MARIVRVQILPALCFGLTCSLTGCGSARATAEAPTDQPEPVTATLQAPARPILGGRPIAAKPFAVIYKTNRDLDNHVTIGYDRATRTIISYPAPTDVDTLSAPMHLIDGWLLDRRGGIGDNTAFLRWTYGEYCAMKTVPTLSEIRAAIMPDARVTEVKRLDITTFEAQQDTAAVNAYIRTL